jgi:hypothetical protein
MLKITLVMGFNETLRQWKQMIFKNCNHFQEELPLFGMKLLPTSGRRGEMYKAFLTTTYFLFIIVRQPSLKYI